MDTSGFYFNDNGTLLFGPNYVLNIEFELYRDKKNEYDYPVSGWYWFDSEEEAYAFWGLENPNKTDIDLDSDGASDI